MSRFLIVNADDFGASDGVNRGIVESHTRGIVTSTSVMTTGRAVQEAIGLSRGLPDLALGLHWDVLGEDEREFDLTDLGVVREEFHRQLEDFRALVGRDPTHIDSHRHTHRSQALLPVFEELVAPLQVPLRHSGEVRFVGEFYAQWEWGVTQLEYVSVECLEKLLRREVREGWVEFSCHPGYRSPDYHAMYLVEREHELQTLTHPRIRQVINELGISLVSYADYALSRA